MTSEPASFSSQELESDRDGLPESAKIPLKYKSLDVASQIRSVKEAEPDLARLVGDYSNSVEQTLGTIEAIEATLRHKRRQIDEIQARQKVLAREYRELGETLDRANRDLAQQFAGIIRDLEANLPIAKPAVEAAPETAPETAAKTAAHPTVETGAKPESVKPESAMGDTAAAKPADRPAEAGPRAAAPPAPTAPESAPPVDEASGLDLDPANMPPVPEFLGDPQGTKDRKGGGASEDAGSGGRGWWSMGKKN